MDLSLGAMGVAVLVSLLSCWLTGRLCAMSAPLAVLDYPGDRSLHSRPTPRTGGLAIWAGLVIGLAGIALLDQGGRSWPPGWSMQAEAGAWIVGMAGLIGLISFLDDYKSVPAGVRLAVHAVAASGVVIGAGLKVPSLAIPVIGTIPLGWLAVPTTVLFLVWMANLYNFMDGMDGFAGGMTWLGFGFLATIAWMKGHSLIFSISLLISMAAAGFLFYNRPPARIFMGDVGSVPIGFLAASLAVQGVHDGVFDLWVPILIFSTFIVDATVTVLRRMLWGQKFWRAHREHYYQRLVLAGWGHRKTMLAEYALMLATGTTAVLYVHVTEAARLAIVTTWLVGYVSLARGVRGVELKAKDPRGAA